MITTILKKILSQFATALIGLAALMLAPTTAGAEEIPEYKLQPGDVLSISVWKEEDLSQAVIIRPDGFITFPFSRRNQCGGA